MSWRYLFWLIPVYLIALVILAPAQIVGWGVQQYGNGMVQMQNLSGTIWNGKGGLTRIILPTGTSLKLENIEWGVSPLLLIQGKLGLNFEIPEQGNLISGSGRINASQQGLQTLEANLSGAIAQSSAALNLPLPLNIDGDWRLNLSEYSLSDFASPGWCDTLTGQIHTDVRVRLNNVWLPLGEFRADLDCGDPQTINVSIPPENRLGLQVNAALHGSRSAPRVRMQGSIKPTLQTPAEVSELLVYIGQPDASGRYSFSFNL